ncbi:MAG: B12-binding domain-containing radical SAM protein [Deltaproteobacteria bacterium]|nr:B12-binding domain-containing radical SAM protein [Deltaproteobacteria bacterium]
MMKLLLVNPPWKLDSHSVYSATGAIYPPLGFASMAAVLASDKTVQTEVLDAWGLGLGLDRFVQELKSRRPDVIGISMYTTTVVQALAAARAAKSALPAATVVAGGPHASILPEEVIEQPCIDYVVRGEGEPVLPRLLDYLRKCGSSSEPSLSTIPGLTYRHQGRTIHNAGVGYVEDLNSLPWPARELLPMHIYRPASGAYRRLPVTSMMTTRGCPFACGFCSKAIFGNHVRYRSVANVIAEIEYLIERYGVKEIYFADDCFTMDRGRTEALCDQIRTKGLDLTWTCSTRVNLVDPPLLRRMRQAGCVSIGFGIETASVELGDLMHKRISPKDARAALGAARLEGIETRTSYILGFPGEDLESLTRTVNLALDLDSDFVIFNLAIPLPGTDLYRLAKEKHALMCDGFELYPKTDGAHVLIRLEDVPARALEEFYRKAYRRYYLRPRYVLRRLRSLRSPRDLLGNMKGLFEFLRWNRGANA